MKKRNIKKRNIKHECLTKGVQRFCSFLLKNKYNGQLLWMAALVCMLASCSASLTDYGYKDGVYCNMFSPTLPIEKAPPFNNTYFGEEREGIETILDSYYYPYPTDSLVVRRYLFPVKIVCVDGRAFKVQTRVYYSYEQYKHLFRNFMINTTLADMANDSIVGGKGWQAQNRKCTLMRVKYAVEVPDIKKKDKTLFLKCNFQVNPVNHNFCRANYHKTYKRK